ncbi:DUF1349 domain-containing protein [Micromonospora tarensis]|uniref:DUF1349 domain-containing protein n=1 Tax=Micromonospora tarensis TaxID=2806100 RepID=A0ABS1YH31_9ACTN|nr:DUF1349 domain-containing protein [Micromonospora tarensis]MBM0276677.1 DUF1349 domain-containing protein [Micromonospora tarensis]
MPGRAVVKVTTESFFGPLVKNYVFDLVPDTTLTALRVDDTPLRSFSPTVPHYNVLVPAGSTTVPTVTASAADPAPRSLSSRRRRHRAGPGHRHQRCGVVGLHGGPEHRDHRQRRLHLDPTRRAVAVGPAGRQQVAAGDGSLVVTAQQGDLQGSTNTARNLAVQDVNGDWTAESKVVFSRPLASDNEQGGVLAYADDDNYVKLAWEMGNATAAVNKARVVFLREQNGATSTVEITGADAQRIVGADGAIWLRLTKIGGSYRAYYSSDGSVYRFVGSTTLNAEPTKAGLLAFNRAGNSTDLDVAFDHFRIASRGEQIRRR